MLIRNRLVGGLVAAAAAGLLVAAIGPAAAAAPQPGRPAVSADVATAPATAAQAPRKAKVRRYCLRFDVTGSRIPVEECKTKAEWEDAGVDTSDFDK